MNADVAIVGAGVIGCAIARALAREGRSVVVLDRDEPGRHASWAAAGMLAPQAEADKPAEFLDLLLRARALFPAIAAELKEETGLDIGYRTEGMIFTALDEAGEAELRARFEWQHSAGLQVEMLSGDAARGLEPVLSPAVRSALLFAGDHQVDNRILVRALWFSAHAAGARFAAGHTVRRIDPAGAGVSVELTNGQIVSAELGVLAAGAWSGTIEGPPRSIPVEPVHGQLIALETAPPILRHTVAHRQGYLVPRADGRLIVGATVERVGFRAAATPGGLRQMSEVAMRAVPELECRRIVAHWSGFRPGTPDGLPILGQDPEMPQLLYATGHYRNGILLAPLTGQVIADLAFGRPSPIDLAPYRPHRFED